MVPSVSSCLVSWKVDATEMQMNVPSSKALPSSRIFAGVSYSSWLLSSHYVFRTSPQPLHGYTSSISSRASRTLAAYADPESESLRVRLPSRAAREAEWLWRRSEAGSTEPFAMLASGVSRGGVVASDGGYPAELLSLSDRSVEMWLDVTIVSASGSGSVGSSGTWRARKAFSISGWSSPARPWGVSSALESGLPATVFLCAGWTLLSCSFCDGWASGDRSSPSSSWMM